MTGMLASVSNLSEAQIALEENVDIIDLKDPAHGTLGAVTTEVALDIVKLVSGHCIVSATIGDLPMQATRISQAISIMASTGVDIIKVGAFDDLTDEVIEALKEQAIKGAQADDGMQFSIVIVLFVDKGLNLEIIPDLAAAGVRGIMLDTANKSKGNLRTQMRDKDIKAFVVQSKSFGLMTGLAGSLCIGDIAPLLELAPDYLGFRGALCQDNLRTQAIDSSAVRKVRSMITNDKEEAIYANAGLR